MAVGHTAPPVGMLEPLATCEDKKRDVGPRSATCLPSPRDFAEEKEAVCPPVVAAWTAQCTEPAERARNPRYDDSRNMAVC